MQTERLVDDAYETWIADKKRIGRNGDELAHALLLERLYGKREAPCQKTEQ